MSLLLVKTIAQLFIAQLVNIVEKYYQITKNTYASLLPFIYFYKEGWV